MSPNSATFQHQFRFSRIRRSIRVARMLVSDADPMQDRGVLTATGPALRHAIHADTVTDIVTAVSSAG
jgi:hypothetical protein